MIGGGEGLSAVQLTRWLKNVNIVDGKKVNIGFRKIRVKESHVLKKWTPSSYITVFTFWP